MHVQEKKIRALTNKETESQTKRRRVRQERIKRDKESVRQKEVESDRRDRRGEGDDEEIYTGELFSEDSSDGNYGFSITLRFCLIKCMVLF